jgi:hypothetical protein
MAPKQKIYANIYCLAYSQEFLEKMLIIKLTALESLPLAPTALSQITANNGRFPLPLLALI